MGILQKFFGNQGNGRYHPAMTPDQAVSPATQSKLSEALLASASDIDAIWYYERLKWQARD